MLEKLKCKFVFRFRPEAKGPWQTSAYPSRDLARGSHPECDPGRCVPGPSAHQGGSDKPGLLPSAGPVPSPTTGQPRE